MKCNEFFKETVLLFDDDLFSAFKDSLLSERLITFMIIDTEDISKEILSEKICDYFEKYEIKSGKSFDKCVDLYMENFDSVVKNHIAEEPKKKKDEAPKPIPRSRKYYEYAKSLKDKKNEVSIENLMDFSRIMMCLYMESIHSFDSKIDNFEFSSVYLNLNKIIAILKSEKEPIGKKYRFDISEPYHSDNIFFILVIIMYYYIKSKEIAGD